MMFMSTFMSFRNEYFYNFSNLFFHTQTCWHTLFQEWNVRLYANNFSVRCEIFALLFNNQPSIEKNSLPPWVSFSILLTTRISTNVKVRRILMNEKHEVPKFPTFVSSFYLLVERNYFIGFGKGFHELIFVQLASYVSTYLLHSVYITELIVFINRITSGLRWNNPLGKADIPI